MLSNYVYTLGPRCVGDQFINLQNVFEKRSTKCNVENGYKNTYDYLLIKPIHPFQNWRQTETQDNTMVVFFVMKEFLSKNNHNNVYGRYMQTGRSALNIVLFFQD